MVAPTLFADDFVFLEAPKWNGGLLWVSDVFDHKVYTLTATAERRVACEMHRPTGLGFLPDGSLVVVDAEAFMLRRLKDGVLSDYADLSGHAAGYLNDFAVDAAGRIYVGNFGYDYEGGEGKRPTSLHRVDRDGTISEVASGVEFPNGSVIIDGGRTLVVAETWAGRLSAFDLSKEGKLSNHRLFADLGERMPDGLCADAANAVWVGCFNTGEFVRVAGARVTDTIKFDGASGVSCALGGESGNQLFMTVYQGSVDDIAARRRKAAIFTRNVDVPALTYI